MVKNMYSVALVNMRDGSVQGHKGDCADLKRGKSYADEPWVLDVEDKAQAWLEYNVDFIAEGGEENAWDIKWLPCADHVPAGDPHKRAVEDMGDAFQEDSPIDTSPAMSRLRYLVGVAMEPTYTTRGGQIKNKTAKRREIERTVADEVVRFAFDHAGIKGDGNSLAPTGLFLQLMNEVGGKR